MHSVWFRTTSQPWALGLAQNRPEGKDYSGDERAGSTGADFAPGLLLEGARIAWMQLSRRVGSG